MELGAEFGKDSPWRPRIQKALLGTVEGVCPGKYVAIRDLPRGTALIVTWSSPDQAHPEIAMLRGDGVAERVERPGGGYIGFASSPDAGDLLISNATDTDMEDIQVYGLRATVPVIVRDPEPVYRLGEPVSVGGPESPAPPLAH